MGSLAPAVVNIVDIRKDKSNASLLDVVENSLKPRDGAAPSLPTLLLYDEKGLKLFQDITYLDEYYLTNAEIETLTKHADSIVAHLPGNIQLIELGSGNLRKVELLLKAFERACKPVKYFALDLSYPELQRTFAELDLGAYEYVSFNALHGTYDDGLAWLSKPENQDKVNCIMSLGSSLGNFARDEAAQFLAGFKNALKPGEYMIVGLDGCQDADRIFSAYNDKTGVTTEFYWNGLDHANRVLDSDAFNHRDWVIETEYDAVNHRHHTSLAPKTDVTVTGRLFRQGDKIHFEHAYKYTEEQTDRLWHDAGLVLQSSFDNERGDYHLHLLSPSATPFPVAAIEYAAAPVPALQDWHKLWSVWDTATKAMVPKDELLAKPIKLRNTLIFYLGHIPAFGDIHFARATGKKLTEPAYFATIFERGIDPDVDNPEKCHDHSPIPDEWPPLQDILEYSVKVRARIAESIECGAATADKKLSRSLWLAFEHEAMHLETFLYMLLQSQRTLPPPGESRPDFASRAKIAENAREPNAWHQIPAAEVEIGLNDPDHEAHPNSYFGWDNEQPARTVTVPEFEAQSRPISNGEYAYFLEQTKNPDLPASWVRESAASPEQPKGLVEVAGEASDEYLTGKIVRTVFGSVPLKDALDWPVMASYDELAAYARWANGRIPTFEETRSIYHFVEREKKNAVERVSSSLISAVNGHLINDGVEETPPSQHLSRRVVDGDNPNPSDTFIDLTGCNIGFTTWHPTAVTGEGARLRGQGDCGGAWEWTSTPLAPHDGFRPMELYPGYTADFFDDKHNICLGGSWATVPRIAGRKSFVNWYQRNYPFTWATARLVRDSK